MRRILWSIGMAHDGLLAVVLVVGGPIAIVVGAVVGSAPVAGVGGLALVGGVMLGIDVLRSDPPPRKRA